MPFQGWEVAIRGVVIAGTNSGCGKTTVALGLMAALKRRGYRVAPFKVGPDFIDPGHHQRITGRESRNLDGWMLSQDYNRGSFRKHAANADFAVVEGVMGLFDGYDGKSEAGSTAQMAKWLGLPVLLVVNAKSMARSAAAMVQGFENFDREVTFAGVVFNNIGSPRHLQYLTDALEGHVRLPRRGALARNDTLVIPERHLGLVTDQDHPLTEDYVGHLVRMMEDGIDVTGLIQALPATELPAAEILAGDDGSFRSVSIGVARDKAFCFYYPDNLELLSAAGAELVFFSPASDSRLPEDIDGLYFGGGYPELLAAELSGNQTLRRQVREKHAEGMPIYGECGGFMYLCDAICDVNGQTHSMTGCFPFKTRMHARLRSLGYREITLTQNTIIGKRGQTIRGHEFHYSGLTKIPQGIDTVYRVISRNTGDAVAEGYRIKRTLGSYHHLHFGSRPDAAAAFVDNCRCYNKERRQ
ncbi:MAG: cobyrinate a,c-diamide synthase [Deltaproteobacteria bacterium]|nr:cobyrinate a,c-diamide synthase [Deltaproteobacteria bacterium]